MQLAEQNLARIPRCLDDQAHEADIRIAPPFAKGKRIEVRGKVNLAGKSERLGAFVVGGIAGAIIQLGVIRGKIVDLDKNVGQGKSLHGCPILSLMSHLPL